MPAIIWRFCTISVLDEIRLILSLRVILDKSKLEIESLAPLLEGANWIEREIFEMLGIKFIGHPELKRLLLPDDWPERGLSAAR